MEISYRRHLPHYQPPGGTYFVTFRLAGSPPVKNVGTQASLGKPNYCNDHFARLTSMVASPHLGPRWLQRADIAEVVQDAIFFRDGIKYDLYASCIMPTHVHMVFELRDGATALLSQPVRDGNAVQNKNLVRYPVTEILGSLKKHTALEANRILRRRGAFWKSESYDHLVRDGAELERILWYVLFNPQKAGLVKSWKDWKWTYCKPGLLQV